MTERERLIELLDNFCDDIALCDICKRPVDDCLACRNERCAEYLLANNVVALPELKYKQVLYLIHNRTVKSLEVSSYMIRPEFNNLLQIHLYKNGFNGCCTLDDFGKTVFLTKEETEKALEEMKK